MSMKKYLVIFLVLLPTLLLANDVRLVTSTNGHLEGKNHPKTGVPFERVRTTRHTGEIIDIVVPRFHSFLDVQLPQHLYLASDSERRSFLANALLQAVTNHPNIANQFTESELIEIRKLKQPKHFAWHDDAPVGKIQLVDREIHNKTGHVGGRWIWGGGSDSRS